MNENYQTPIIQIIEFAEEISLASSTVINYPWKKDEDFEYFE